MINMRGVDLNRFDFDFDQEWAALFLAADGHIYGRFHAPSADTMEKYLTLPALRHAMQGALQQHRERGQAAIPREEAKPRTVEQYPAAAGLRATACIHCHQAHEYQRQAEQAAGRWKKDDVWIYPPPENIGLTLGVVKGNVVTAVAERSAVARLGLKPGDTLRKLGDHSVCTIADLQYALHHAPAKGGVDVSWERAGQAHSGRLELTDGWRQSDLSWRASMKRFGPPPLVDGEDLTPEEKRPLGLKVDQLAFRQNAFPAIEARQAGIRSGDIILGINGQKRDLTVRQFRMSIQLGFEPGDSVTFNILRAGQRLEVPVTLPRRLPF